MQQRQGIATGNFNRLVRIRYGSWRKTAAHRLLLNSVLYRLQFRRQDVTRVDFIIPVAAQEKKVSGVGIRHDHLDDIECHFVCPLQVV